MSAPPSLTLEAQLVRYAERVVGACVVEPKKTLDARANGVTSAMLPKRLHLLWGELCRQADEGFAELDITGLRDLFARVGEDDRTTIRHELVRLESEGLGSRFPDYADDLRRAHLRLCLIAALKQCTAAEELGYDDDAATHRAEVEAIRAELASIGQPVKGWHEELTEIAEAASTPNNEALVPTGLAMLDEHMGGGMSPGWLVVVMGGAKSGKSALAGNGFVRAACKAGKRCLVVSLEMSRKECIQRWMAAESSVPVRAMRKGDATPAQASTLAVAIDTLAPWRVEVSTTASSVDAIASTARAYARDGLDLLVVDYLQLVSNGLENRVLDLERTTRGLKLLASELKCVVVLLSQPNNADAKSGEVGLFSGKGSGSIAADCDALLVPLRDPEDDQKAGLHLVGFRHGAPHKWPLGSLTFSGVRMAFEEPGVTVRYTGGGARGAWDA